MCSSQQHNLYGEFYDGRVKVVRVHGNCCDMRCGVCGFEYMKLHHRLPDGEPETLDEWLNSTETIEKETR
jgi:hypothetical protein